MAGVRWQSLALTAATVFLFGIVKCYQDVGDLVIVVRSQPNTYHARRAQLFKEHIEHQQTDKEVNGVAVYLIHEQWPEVGSWTILPLVTEFAEDFPTRSWILVCEDETRINLSGLREVLQRYNAKKEHFLGKALQDKQPVITHHFAFSNDPSSFSYPDFAAGFLLSLPLVQRLASEWLERRSSIDFTIDPKHELAMFIWNDGNGVSLTNVPELCAGKETENCVTTFPQHFPDCGEPVPKEDLFVAVKTCQKFHKDRVKVVKETWAGETGDIEYYSETEDPSVPTINLGVPNTDRGHCGKTMAILKRIYEHPEISKKSWILIADDDTIISLSRLRELLACYNPEETVAVGERYGYGVSQGYGYDYITGGGGMVLSRLTVYQLMDSGLCSCVANDSPDDMTLGMCLQRLAIPVTHSSLFHQARPDDYSDSLLAHERPISFHKHWMVDPYKVYEDWFSHDQLIRDEL